MRFDDISEGLEYVRGVDIKRGRFKLVVLVHLPRHVQSEVVCGWFDVTEALNSSLFLGTIFLLEQMPCFNFAFDVRGRSVSSV